MPNSRSGNRSTQKGCDMHQDGTFGVNGHTPDNTYGQTSDVTREQGGQFIDEGSEIIRTLEGDEAALEGDIEAGLMDADTRSVNAMQVTMDRSGADYIHAQKAFLTNSGAKEITGEATRLTQSGVLTLNAHTASFSQSSAVFANAKDLTLESGSVVYASAESVRMSGNTDVGAMQGRDLHADGDVRAFMLVSDNVHANGDVRSTFTGTTAAIFGAAAGAVIVILSRLLGKRDS